MDIYSYVVRYDSGFAPNPYYGYCTLATCKPEIRKAAKINDWVIGVGSASQKIKQGGRLVYAMKISEVLNFNKYFNDPRFQNKKPIINGSMKQVRGDNIYAKENKHWSQLNSFHSQEDGSPNSDHIKKDTKVDRVLVSEHYRYFGADGPKIPHDLICNGRSLCHSGIGRSKFSGSNKDDGLIIASFVDWIEGFEGEGLLGYPFDWCDVQ